MIQKNKLHVALANLAFILPLIVVAIVFRWLVLRNNSFPFWFDSARDAIVSREILEHHHLKLQGPNVAGTHDTVFHGVLYYYVIGPIYTLFSGNPFWVAFILGTLTTLTIIPVFALTYEFSQSKKTSLLAAMLYAFSYDAIRGGTWLSNPSLTTLILPIFFWLLWKTFFQKQKKYFLLLSCVLGIATQFELFFITLWGEIFLAYWYVNQKEKSRFMLSMKDWLEAGIIYLIAISTIILTELKMIKLGLLNWHTFADFSSSKIIDITAISGTLIIYLHKITEMMLPSFPVAGIFLFLFITYHILKKRSSDQSFFFTLIFTGPLWLLAWHYREMYHIFIGLEAPLIIALALLLQKISTTKFGQYISACIIGIFFISQLRMWNIEKTQRLTPYFLPQGAYLNDELHLIDKTYQISNGQPFSISTLTNPYGYNTLWAYLYSWYGQQKYHYTPNYFGPDQTGLFGADLLTRVKQPNIIHFVIEEPPDGIPIYMHDTFLADQQAKVGTPSAKFTFGTLILEMYRK